MTTDDRIVKEEYDDTLRLQAGYYAQFVEKYHYEPSYKAYMAYCSDAGAIVDAKKEDLSIIREQALASFPDFQNHKYNESDFTQEYFESMEMAIKNHRRFIVTSAVTGRPVNFNFLQALQSYAHRNNALILVLPSVENKKTTQGYKFNYDPLLKQPNIFIVASSKDKKYYDLNQRVAVAPIRIAPSAVNPLSGLNKIATSLDKTFIFPSPKQQMFNIATHKGNIPHAIIATGAVTEKVYVNNDERDSFVIPKTAIKADCTHVCGAFIVELEDEFMFHKRPIQATEQGSFTDLNKVYYPDGRVEDAHNTCIVMGDSHAGATDASLYACIGRNFIIEPFITSIVLHDVCDSGSSNHHESKDTVKLAQRAEDKSILLQQDIDNVAKYLNNLTAFGKDVYVVPSNHDNHIEQSVRELRTVSYRDFANMPLQVKGWLAMTKDNVDNILEYLVCNESTVGLTRPELVKWIKEDESTVINGAEVGMHGHRGANGGRGNIKTLDNLVGNLVIAHSHSAGIYNGTFQVGTTSKLDMGYNKGLSSWTRTCCLIHADGTKQLIDFIPHSEGTYTYHV